MVKAPGHADHQEVLPGDCRRPAASAGNRGRRTPAALSASAGRRLPWGRLARGCLALASLSLLVGGVVLMNILLISVGERTKEIGLRRAVGARRRDIFTQFLMESLAVTLIGMVLGSGLGWAASAVLARVTQFPVLISWEPFALALAFALMVGVFFGVQPARRAARLHPVEALK